jgi:hypothetical protein
MLLGFRGGRFEPPQRSACLLCLQVQKYTEWNSGAIIPTALGRPGRCSPWRSGGLASRAQAQDG